jgi:hypothetical protein
MTKRALMLKTALTALCPSAVGCSVGGDASPTSSTDVYSVALVANTAGNLPMCTTDIAGTVAFIRSPPSLYVCDSNSSWTEISCTVAKSGSVAYANSSPPVFVACVKKQWTQIPLPHGETGPRGPAGPPGPTGEAGAPAVITTTQLPAGDPNCPAGGVKIDVTSNGSVQPPVYVCNGVEDEDATAVDGGDGEAGPNAIQQYAMQNARAFCSGQANCCPGDGGGFDIAGCAQAYYTGGWRSWLPANAAAYTAGHLTLNSSQASSCISALQNFPCGTVNATQFAAILNACNGVLIGTLSTGSGGCVSSFECANGYCNSSADGGSGTGVCSALVGDGGACASGSDSPDQMCSQAGVDQPRLWCDLTFSTDGGGTCMAPLADAASCYNATAGVWDDYGCASMLCGDNGCGSSTTAYPDPLFCASYTDAGGGG